MGTAARDLRDLRETSERPLRDLKGIWDMGKRDLRDEETCFQTFLKKIFSTPPREKVSQVSQVSQREQQQGGEARDLHFRGLSDGPEVSHES